MTFRKTRENDSRTVQYVKGILASALERQAYLDRACADFDLRRELEALARNAIVDRRQPRGTSPTPGSGVCLLGGGNWVYNRIEE